MCYTNGIKRLHYQISKVFCRHIWRINTIKADSTADIFMELLRAIIAAIIFMLRVCPNTYAKTLMTIRTTIEHP